MRRTGPNTVVLDLGEIEVVDAYHRLLDEGLSVEEAVAVLDEAGSFVGRAELRAYLLS